jgi:hypothetical protein
MPRTLSALIVACAMLGPGVARAQDADDAAALKMADDMQTAVTKGIRWLTAQQKPDGTWSYDNTPMQLPGQFPMRSGVTALCAFALMKCGIKPDDPVITKAFDAIHKGGFKWTYEAGCILLALEARANFDPTRKPIQAPSSPYGGSRVREPKKKKKKKNQVPARDRKLAETCVKWLVSHQRDTGLWRYDVGSDEDVSNAQYAMLGLDAAERMNVKVPVSVYEKAARRLVEIQKKVPSKLKDVVVPPFPIPGADKSFKELKKLERNLLKAIKKINKKFKKVAEGGKDEKTGQTYTEHVRTAERKVAEELTSGERRKFRPRGWQYYPPETGGMPWQRKTTGALTCSAIASLFICKSRLEAGGRWRGDLPQKVNESIRDGCAWISVEFGVNRNPGAALHQLYYLYGLERAGVLGLIERFGTHRWFDKGARQLLKQQGSGGSWRGSGTTSGPVPDTCFALLFLARGTTPVVRIPGRVMTGVDRK